MLAIERAGVPVVACVQGTAVAGGAQLVAGCDLAYAAEGARFGMTGINLGLFCSTPAVPLSRSVGPKAAMDLLLTGRLIDAAEAARIGLINAAVPGDGLEAHVAEVAASIAEKPPEVVRLGKALLQPAAADGHGGRLCRGGCRDGGEPGTAGDGCRDRRLSAAAADGVITPAFARTMARYNAEMNRRMVGAAAGLPDAQRRQDAGLFWRSIHGTFSHLLWADHIWMARLAGWERPAAALAESGRYHEGDFADFALRRRSTDAELVAWADVVDETWLAGELTWFSGATGREQRHPRGLLLAHVANHQTHHRGQVHALLTRFGADPGATDLPFVLE